MNAAGAEPLYLLAQGTMRAAQATGYAAVLAVKDAALAMMSRAAELDERVDAAGPHRALGAWRAALPIAAGGGAAASRAHFERARSLAPDGPPGAGRRGRDAGGAAAGRGPVRRAPGARCTAFDLSSDPARAPENRIAKRRAAELAKRRARLF